MYASDWEQLGIAPTRDLVAIKRAYAVRLKVTRPDDDAEAYQALRGAYERAQYWARYIEDEVAEGEDDATAESPEATAVAAPAVEAPAPEAPPAPAEPEPELEPDPEWLGLDTPSADETPEALTQRSFDCWQAGGDQALVEAWPQIEAALSRLPLSQRAEASARFADLVISVPHLPYAFLQPLQSHFGWLGDFRTDRLIGPARAEALRNALADVVVPEVTDPQIRHRLSHVLRFHNLLQRPSPMWAWFHAALLGWPLHRQMLEAGARLLLGLGIDAGDQRKMTVALKFGAWLRMAALILLVCGGCRAVSDERWVDLIARVIGTVVVSFIAFNAALIAGTRLSGAFDGSVPWVAPLARGLERLRAGRFGPWTGLAIMAAGTGVFAACVYDPEPLWTWLLAILLVMIGIVPCWPARPDRGVVAVGVWGFLWICLMRVAPPQGWLGVVWGVSGICTLLGVLLTDGRWRLPAYNFAWYIAILLGYQLVRQSVHQIDEQSALRWLMIAAIAVAMPWLSLARANHDGHRFALASIALAGSVVLAAGRGVDAAWLLVAWLVATCALMGLQQLAQWAAGRWARAASPAG